MTVDIVLVVGSVVADLVEDCNAEKFEDVDVVVCVVPKVGD